MAFVKGTYYRLKTKVAQKLTDDRYVFMLVSPEKLHCGSVEGEEVHRFRHLEDVPNWIMQILPETVGGNPSIIAKNFDLGLRLFVVTVGETFGSMGWVRLGKDFNWIIPLRPNDIVIGRAYTNPQLRGRGLYGRLNIARIQEDFDGQAKGGRVFGDCHIYNNAPMRQLLKTGAFKLVARVRPLKPRETNGLYSRLSIKLP